MRIVIDMQGAQTESRFRGIGRYTMSLARAIVRNRGEHEIILALNSLFPDTIEPIRTAFDDLLPQENIRVWYTPGPVNERESGNKQRRRVAELIREAFLASLEPDVIHISSLFEGYLDNAVTSIDRFDHTTPVSVSLYDLIPLLNPDHYLEPNPAYAQYYRLKIEHLKKAAAYLAISEFTRQEGITHLDVPQNRVATASPAVDSGFKPFVVENNIVSQLQKKSGLTRPFIMCAGGADDRKNVPRLIQAFAALPSALRRAHQLLLVGQIPDGNIAQFNHQAKKLGINPDELRFMGYVTDEELVYLYNLCKLFVFPSWHEGFGLPALEAMACGAPVIASNTSSLPEVIDLDEALFDPLNVTAITAKIAQALEDDAFRSNLSEHGLQQAKLFSWDDAAKQAIALWEQLQEWDVQHKSPGVASKRKPKMAYVSPLPPEHTGIANYSAELLPALAEFYDIEVVVTQDEVGNPWINDHAKVRDVSWLRAHADEFDRVLYQVGNSPFHQHMLSLIKDIPGTVVLHDFFLGHMVAWLEHEGIKNYWINALYLSQGYKAVRAHHLGQETALFEYPVNLCVLQHTQGLIVHSEYTRELVQHWYDTDFSKACEVIPHLRTPAEAFDRSAARKQLCLDEKDFLVCSFGFLASTKLNHRLIESWISSDLSRNTHCRLVFVGENPGDDYGMNLLKAIHSSGLGDRIFITGYASPDMFRRYLRAADVAVQLRTNSRGETSGAVLDCMNHALPLIANANGSVKELDPEAVWMLPDEFDNAHLIDALETLWREPERRRILGKRAREIILNNHTPSHCARRYAEAIERFHSRTRTSVPSLVRAITADEQFVPDDTDLLHISKTVAATLPVPRPSKSLFLDISATCRNNLKTGIERVAHALLLALLEAPPAGYRVEPVYLCYVGGQWYYRYARRYTLELLGCPSTILHDEIAEPECGDILLGLDISGDMLIQAERAGLFTDYRNRGVSVYFMVHDLLPVLMPQVFPPGANEVHDNWLRAISRLDGAICVSKTTADDLAAWQKQAGIDRSNQRPFRIAWSHHGSDFTHSAPSRGLPDSAERTLRQLREYPTFLMVGTIEPRKGYQQAIEAFTILWDRGLDINLAIVGSRGWGDLPDAMRRDIPETVNRLQTHPELNKHLFWLEGISDEYLEKVYTASNCLITASYGEGFGLPLIEAAQHKLHIIARDIPVFHEVAAEHAFYFQARNGSELAKAITDWLTLYNTGKAPLSVRMPFLTWKQSAERLLQLCVPNK